MRFQRDPNRERTRPLTIKAPDSLRKFLEDYAKRLGISTHAAHKKILEDAKQKEGRLSPSP